MVSQCLAQLRTRHLKASVPFFYYLKSCSNIEMVFGPNYSVIDSMKFERKKLDTTPIGIELRGALLKTSQLICLRNSSK